MLHPRGVSRIGAPHAERGGDDSKRSEYADRSAHAIHSGLTDPLSGAPPTHLESHFIHDRVRSNGWLGRAAPRECRATSLSPGRRALIAKPWIKEVDALTEATTASVPSSLDRSRCGFGDSIFFRPWHSA